MCVVQDRKKYKATEEALLQRYNIVFAENMLKNSVSTLEAEAAKAEDGYDSEHEREQLIRRYPTTAIKTEPSSSTQSAPVAYTGSYASMPSLSPGLLSPTPPLTQATRKSSSFSPSTATAASSSYQRGVLSSLQDIANSARALVEILGGDRSKVAAAVKLLQSGEADDDDDEEGDEEESHTTKNKKRKTNSKKKASAVVVDAESIGSSSESDTSERKSPPSSPRRERYVRRNEKKNADAEHTLLDADAMDEDPVATQSTSAPTLVQELSLAKMAGKTLGTKPRKGGQR